MSSKYVPGRLNIFFNILLIDYKTLDIVTVYYII